MPEKTPWSELPRAVVYEITRLERSTEPKKGPFHFPVVDIPRRCAIVWALQAEGEGPKETALREARLEKAFKGVARSAHSGYGAQSEGKPWAFYVSAKSLHVLPLDEAGLTPEQVVAQEESDWEQIALGLERWAAKEFPQGYRMDDPESKSRHDNGDETLQALHAELMARREARSIDQSAAPGAPAKRGVSI